MKNTSKNTKNTTNPSKEKKNNQPKKKEPLKKRIINFFNYYFVEPIQDIKQKKDFGNEQSSIWRLIFAIIAIVSLFAISFMSSNAGNSGDEHFHLEQAEHVYNYYTTFGEDSTAAVITEKYNLP